MDLKIYPVVLKISNYAVWAPNMETLLKSKGFWKYTKVVIPDLTDEHANLFLGGKKDEVVRVITTYILWEIYFNLSGINYPHQFCKKLK
jgi:hypothetical protein